MSDDFRRDHALADQIAYNLTNQRGLLAGLIYASIDRANLVDLDSTPAKDILDYIMTDDIKTYVQGNYAPQDIFTRDKLRLAIEELDGEEY